MAVESPGLIGILAPESHQQRETLPEHLLLLNAVVSAWAANPTLEHLELTGRLLARALRLDVFSVWLEESIAPFEQGLTVVRVQPHGSLVFQQPQRTVIRLARLAVRRRLPTARVDAIGSSRAKLGDGPGVEAVSAASLPMLAGGRPLGALVAGRFHRGGFDAAEFQLLSLVANVIASRLASMRSLEASRQELDRQIQQNDRLNELDRLRAEFVSIVAHELRSPLAGISAHAWTLTEYWERLSEGERRRSIVSIRRRAHRLDLLLSRLLVLSRVEAGLPLEVQPRVMDLAPLIVQLSSELSAEYGERPVRMDLPGHLPQVLADSASVEQVLSSLIDNAMKFSPMAGEVCVRATVLPGEVVVRVSDNGPGIPESEMPELFQRSTRLPVDTGHAPRGTGIGLYVARKLVEAQGGRIWATSQVGRGSTFSFTLARTDGQGGDTSPAS